MSHHTRDVATLIRQHGHRMTPQRQLILDALCDAGGHATPDEVYQRLQPLSSAINRATVYRTLNVLCEVGLATSTMSNTSHLEYEIAGSKPHHHLVCQVCGETEQIPHSAVAPLYERISEEYEFKVMEQTHLTLFGLCSRCEHAAD